MAESDLLESGDIAFVYRPRVDEDDPDSTKDVQNLHTILRPHGESTIRTLIIGGKRLPEVNGGEGRDRLFAFVEAVFTDPDELDRELRGETYDTETRGQRTQPAARPAAEGSYGIARHDDHTHLAMELELPEQRGPVQKELQIPRRASYVITVKHPDAPTPSGAGLSEHQQADYPQRLLDAFGDRKWTDADPVELLSYPGAEINLIAAHTDPDAELDVDAGDLGTDDESRASADVFQTLRLRRKHHPPDPLFGRDWT